MRRSPPQLRPWLKRLLISFFGPFAYIQWRVFPLALCVPPSLLLHLLCLYLLVDLLQNFFSRFFVLLRWPVFFLFGFEFRYPVHIGPVTLVNFVIFYVPANASIGWNTFPHPLTFILVSYRLLGFFLSAPICFEFLLVYFLRVQSIGPCSRLVTTCGLLVRFRYLHVIINFLFRKPLAFRHLRSIFTLFDVWSRFLDWRLLNLWVGRT